MEAIVPIDDAHYFLDRYSAQRVNRIAKARRVTPVAQYLCETSCSAVLHNPAYRIFPGGKPAVPKPDGPDPSAAPPGDAAVAAAARAAAAAKARRDQALAESVAHKVGVHTPVVIVGKSGIGKSPVVNTNVAVLEGFSPADFKGRSRELLVELKSPRGDDGEAPGQKKTKLPVYREVMTLKTAGTKAKMHGHIIKADDEYVNAYHHVRKDPHSVEGGSLSTDKMYLQELINFITPPQGGGGSSGKTVNNTFEHGNGLIANITPAKTLYYLYDDKGGGLWRISLVHVPRPMFVTLPPLRQSSAESENPAELDGEEREAEELRKALQSKPRPLCDVAVRFLERKHKTSVDQLWLHGESEELLLQTYFNDDAARLQSMLAGGLTNVGSMFLREGDRFDGMPKKLSDACAKFSHHICLDMNNMTTEVFQAMMKDSEPHNVDYDVPDWDMTVLPLHVRGATYVWLLCACSARWVLNMQDAHDYSPFTKAPAGDVAHALTSGDGQRRRSGVGGARAEVENPVRLAVMLVKEGVDAGNTGHVTHIAVRRITQNSRWCNRALVFEVLSQIAAVNGLAAVERPSAAAEHGAPDCDGAAAAVQPRRKRRRAAGDRGGDAGAADGGDVAGVVAAVVGAVAPAPVPAPAAAPAAEPAAAGRASMVPYDQNSGPVSTVKRNGQEAVPEFVLRLPVTAWADSEFARKVIAGGQAPAPEEV